MVLSPILWQRMAPTTAKLQPEISVSSSKLDALKSDNVNLAVGEQSQWLTIDSKGSDRIESEELELETF